MEISSDFITTISLIFAAMLIGYVLLRLIRKQSRHVQERLVKVASTPFDLPHGIEMEAIVVSKMETIEPNAGGYAKVDIILEIQHPDKTAQQISTCWLVEVDSLEQLLPGNKVPVKLDAKKKSRVFPNVPWAKPWIFG
jgi:hypothetical protein